MTTPIACSLDASAHAHRIDSISQINAQGLCAHERDGRVLRLTYSLEMTVPIRQLVAQESECCAFLNFTIEEGDGRLRLTIHPPDVSPDELDTLFAPFLAVTSAMPEETLHQPSGGRVPGAAATSAAVVALACGVCCVVPFAFPAVALTATGGILAAFAGTYRWMMNVAIALTVAGWAWVGYQSVRSRRRPSVATTRAMVIATLLVGVALSWPLLEARIRNAVSDSTRATRDGNSAALQSHS